MGKMYWLLLSTLAFTTWCTALTINLGSSISNPPNDLPSSNPLLNLTSLTAPPREWPPTPYTLPLEGGLSLAFIRYGALVDRARKTEIVRSIRDVESGIRDMGTPSAVFTPQYIGRGRVGVRFTQNRVPAALLMRGQAARVCEVLALVVGILGPRNVKVAEIWVGREPGRVVAMRFEMVVAA